jgi:hypothetical protein
VTSARARSPRSWRWPSARYRPYSACLAAASDLALARTGRQPECSLDSGHVVAAVRSEALLRDPNGRGLTDLGLSQRLVEEIQHRSPRLCIGRSVVLDARDARPVGEGMGYFMKLRPSRADTRSSTFLWTNRPYMRMSTEVITEVTHLDTFIFAKALMRLCRWVGDFRSNTARMGAK